MRPAQDSSLREQCEALLDPLVHYSFEKSLRIVSSILKRADELGYQQLSDAATHTLQKLGEYGNELGRYQFAVNMYERSRWIHDEMKAALGAVVETRDLQRQRIDLFSEPYELCRLNRDQAMSAGRHLVVGEFRAELRQIRSDVEAIHQRLLGASSEAVVSAIHTFFRAQALPIAMLQERLKGVEDKTSPKPELAASLRDLGSLRDAIAAPRFARFSEDERRTGEAPLGAAQYRNALAELRSRVSALEVESRIAFSRELGSVVPESAHRQVSIHEELNAVGQASLDAIRSMMSEWVIDLNEPRPQFGFGRAHTDEELRHYLTTCGGTLFRAELRGETAGYYILLSDSRRFPSEVKEILSQLENAGEYMGVVSGWLQLVGVTKAGRDNAKAADVDLYTILHEAAIDTLSTFRVEKAFAIVREGTFANLAKQSHIKRGWRETGVMARLGQFTYQAIRLDLCPGANWQY
jgi:hypothetical protein